jgi:hypothetical protein
LIKGSLQFCDKLITHSGAAADSSFVGCEDGSLAEWFPPMKMKKPLSFETPGTSDIAVRRHTQGGSSFQYKLHVHYIIPVPKRRSNRCAKYYIGDNGGKESGVTDQTRRI